MLSEPRNASEWMHCVHGAAESGWNTRQAPPKSFRSPVTQSTERRCGDSARAGKQSTPVFRVVSATQHVLYRLILAMDC